MSKPNGGSAFPIPHAIQDWNDQFFKPGQLGMTLRDYFATEALGSVLKGPLFEHLVLITPDPNDISKNAAKVAYEFADQMIAARETIQ